MKNNNLEVKLSLLLWGFVGLWLKWVKTGLQKVVPNGTEGPTFKPCLGKFNCYPQAVRPFDTVTTQTVSAPEQIENEWPINV